MRFKNLKVELIEEKNFNGRLFKMEPEIWAALTEADKKALNEYYNLQFHRIDIPPNILFRSKSEAYGVISRLADTPHPLDSSGSQLTPEQQDRFSEMAQKCKVAYP